MTEPRVGRRERKRAETRDRLFQAALQLFAKKGFANTTVEDITEAADVGKGTFFNYFPTKEHILSYFAERQVATITHWAHEASTGAETAQERLRALLHTASTLPGNNPELVRAAFGSFLANQEARSELQKQVALGRTVIARYLESAQKKKQIRADIPSLLLARTFQQAIFGSVLLWSLHQDAPILSYLETAFEVLWRGISPCDTRSASVTRIGKEKRNGKRS